MSKASGGKKKAKVFYTSGDHIERQTKVAGRGLTKKQRRGEVQPQG